MGLWMAGLGAILGSVHVYDAARGGPILWQHRFWFFGHPEVYIVALPFFSAMTFLIAVPTGVKYFNFWKSSGGLAWDDSGQAAEQESCQEADRPQHEKTAKSPASRIATLARRSRHGSIKGPRG